MYVILGATGNIGSVITDALLAKGEKVRVVGRGANKLQPFVDKGAIPFPAEIRDVAALTKALEGARAAFLLIPPDPSSPDYRAAQEEKSDALVAAVQASGLRYAVNLSSIAAQVPSGTGPIAGLHHAEIKLNGIASLHVLHLRPAYFMENELPTAASTRNMDTCGSALRADMKRQTTTRADRGGHPV